MDGNIIKDIDKNLSKNRYSTRTEFIRDAIRTKLSELEKAEMLKAVERLHGSSKRKTTDEDLHRAGEKAFKKLEKKHGIR
jgi:metal-responsive CopG/Arc/MetJ family transcriptional regulator